METLSAVDFNWKAIQRTLNTVIRGVNARTPIAGDMILIDGAISNGVVISADSNAIAAMIANAVDQAKQSANAKAESEGGGGGGGGISPTTGTDLSGTGEGAGWDFLGPIAASPTQNGSPINIYPNQQDLSNDIGGFLINRHYLLNGVDTVQGQVVVNSDGSTTGSFQQLYDGDLNPVYPSFWYTITYYNGGSQEGPVSPAFTVPLQGGSIVLGDQSLFIPGS